MKWMLILFLISSISLFAEHDELPELIVPEPPLQSNWEMLSDDAKNFMEMLKKAGVIPKRIGQTESFEFKMLTCDTSGNPYCVIATREEPPKSYYLGRTEALKILEMYKQHFQVKDAFRNHLFITDKMFSCRDRRDGSKFQYYCAGHLHGFKRPN